MNKQYRNGHDGNDGHLVADHDVTIEELFSRLADAEDIIQQLRESTDTAEASRDKYFDYYNLAPLGYLTLSQSGIILDANAAAAQLCGVAIPDLINLPFAPFLCPDERISFKSECQRLRPNDPPVSFDIHLSGQQNQQMKTLLEVSITARFCNEQLDYFLVIRDVTKIRYDDELLHKTLEELRLLELTLKEENRSLVHAIRQKHSHEDIVGNSEALCEVLKLVEQVVPTDSRALILGETGSGKELIARAIHQLSPRSGRLMINVNCAALPPTLIESELFGREKGAFTGALSQQRGRFELAHRSTIFLDEIDGIPIELQAKLLRVLETGTFERLGGVQPVTVDVRVIAASNCDLALAVQKGAFREDLYYRLNVFQIKIPPLRERREDIMPLVWSFVDYFSKKMGKRIESIPKQIVTALQTYPWPGNIRELKNVVERAMIISTGSRLLLDIPMIAQAPGNGSLTLDEMERGHIIDALAAAHGQVSGDGGAAKLLGINPKTLASRMLKHGIKRSNNS